MHGYDRPRIPIFEASSPLDLAFQQFFCMPLNPWSRCVDKERLDR